MLNIIQRKQEIGSSGQYLPAQAVSETGKLLNFITGPDLQWQSKKRLWRQESCDIYVSVFEAEVPLRLPLLFETFWSEKKEESGWISDKTNSPHLAYIYLQSQHSAALIITAKTYKKLPFALQSLDPFLGGIKGGTEGSEK